MGMRRACSMGEVGAWRSPDRGAAAGGGYCSAGGVPTRPLVEPMRDAAGNLRADWGMGGMRMDDDLFDQWGAQPTVASAGCQAGCGPSSWGVGGAGVWRPGGGLCPGEEHGLGSVAGDRADGRRHPVCGPQASIRATVAEERANFYSRTRGGVASRIADACAWMSDDILRREVDRTAGAEDPGTQARMISQEAQSSRGFPVGGLGADVRAHRTFSGAYPAAAGLYDRDELYQAQPEDGFENLPGSFSR